MKKNHIEKLIASKNVAKLDLKNGWHLLRHLTGTDTVQLQSAALHVITYFSRPKSLYSLEKKFPANFDVTKKVIFLLRQTNILLNADEPEDDLLIKSAYLPMMKLVSPNTPEFTLNAPQAETYVFVDSQGRIQRKKSIKFLGNLPYQIGKAPLVLSAGLGVFRLNAQEVLVTHPLIGKIHLDRELWRIAKTFSKPTVVKQTSKDSYLNACLFLLRHRILWPMDAEVSSLQKIFPSPKGTSIKIENTCSNVEQSFAPMKVADTYTGFIGQVAWVGECHIQSYLQTFSHAAQQEGWHVNSISVNQANLHRLQNQELSMVVLSPQIHTVEFYRHVALEKFEAARRLIPKIAAEIEKDMENIRGNTQSPILLTSVGKPGLTITSASSSAMQQLNLLFAELNHTLLDRAKTYGNVFLLDEDAVVSQSGIKPYWDDEYHIVAHHTNIDFWSRSINLGLAVDPHREKIPDDYFKGADHSFSLFQKSAASFGPPIKRYFPKNTLSPQGTAHAMAQAMIDFMRRFYVERPVKMIVLEPDHLLWPGSLKHRKRAFPKQYYFVGGMDALEHLGIHEALVALRHQGIKLACNSSLDLPTLQSRWTLENDAANILQFADFEFAEGGGFKANQLRKLSRISGIDERDILWIDLTYAGIKNTKGRYFKGDIWSLRRHLLKAPELHPALKNSTGLEKKSAPQGETIAPDADLATILDELILSELKTTSQEELQRVDDLRLLGFNSLKSFTLLSKLEDMFGLRLKDEQMIESVLFFRSKILHAMTQGLKDRHTRPIPSMVQKDFRQVLLQNFIHPKKPWIFKFVRSTQPFDYEYVSWPQLGEQVSRYIEAYRQQPNLKPGDIISIILPTGLRSVSAFLAAILSGFVPSMLAFPSEKLSFEAFSEWFAEIVDRSETKLILCDEALNDELQRQLVKRNMSVPLMTQPPKECKPLDFEKLAVDTFGENIFLQHSSGTTGLRKAVMIQNRQLMAQVGAVVEQLRLGPQDVCINWSPLYHDMGMVMNLILAVSTAMPVVMISPFDWVKRPDMLFAQITEEKGTIAWLPNFAFFHCVNRISTEKLNSFNLESLRLLVSGGEPITMEAFEQFYKKFSSTGLKKSSFASAYGMAEAVAMVTSRPHSAALKTITVDKKLITTQGIAKAADPSVTDTLTLVSCGRALANVKLEIVGATGEVLPEGHLGEIRVCSQDILMQGYFNDPESTQAVLSENKYLTGDLGFLMDGELYVQGRKKDLVIVSGHNIYPHDVEQYITNQVSGIYPGRVVVFGVFVPEEGTERLVVLAESKFPKQASLSKDQIQVAHQLIKDHIRSLVYATFSVAVSDIQLYDQHVLLKSTSGKLSRRRNQEFYLQSLKS